MADILGVEGRFQKTIKLEAPIEAVYAYFSDLNYVLPRLPEVDRVLRYRDGRYRMLFSADDGRGHGMGLMFDIRHENVENKQVKLLPVPINVKELDGDNSLGTLPYFSGKFTGNATFKQNESHCEVDYHVHLHIEFDVPRFLNFIPVSVLQKMGDGLMSLKISKIGEGMYNSVPHEFSLWRKNNEERVRELLKESREKVNRSLSHK